MDYRQYLKYEVYISAIIVTVGMVAQGLRISHLVYPTLICLLIIKLILHKLLNKYEYIDYEMNKEMGVYKISTFLSYLLIFCYLHGLIMYYTS